MKVDIFDFDLPEELIAQTPLENRSASRLMVLNKETGEVSHHSFKQITNYLHAGDVLVLNNTKVLPARLMGEKVDTGAKIEVLLLQQLEGDRWETLVKPAKRIKQGAKITFGDGRLTAVCVEELEHGGRVLEFSYEGIFYEVLDDLGKMPLPPYIYESLKDKNIQVAYSTLSNVDEFNNWIDKEQLNVKVYPIVKEIKRDIVSDVFNNIINYYGLDEQIEEEKSLKI